MSKLVEINLSPDRATLRSFGYIAFIGFGMLAAMTWTESFLFSFGLGSARTLATGIFTVLSIYCLVMGLVFPSANRFVFIGLSIITFPIGIVLSYVIMALLFFGVFGFVALIMRIVGFDPLARQINSNAKSYWSDSRPSRPRSDYFKQY